MGAVRSNTHFSFRIGSLAMTPLRQRMLEDMKIRNFTHNTQLSYLQQVSGFAKYFQCSPETLGPAEIRAYQLYLANERNVARDLVDRRGGTITVAPETALVMMGAIIKRG
jgi:Phage integrase, N-terminal SAM-like domain